MTQSEQVKESINNFNHLLIYRDLKEDRLINKLMDLIINCSHNSKKELKNKYFNLCSEFLKFAERENLTGDMYRNYLLKLIMCDKNIFTVAVEREREISQNLYQAALHDIKILQEIYSYKLKHFASFLDIEVIDFLDEYNPSGEMDLNYISFQQDGNQFKKIFLKKTAPEIVDYLINYHSQKGSGQLGLYSAFRWQNGELVGIESKELISFSDLIGYESQKQTLKENTERFLAGKRANNVLLYGDSGTGKSSSVKALANEYYSRGLRLLEITKEQMQSIPEILKLLENRGLRFIIFLDDLSYEDFETDYKYLKSVMEGSIESRPQNVLFYATSNRMNIIREKWSDRSSESGEVHPKDTLQEKFSLAERFGIRILYKKPDKKKYLEIVKGLAAGEEIELSTEELEEKALLWEKWHNGLSGRTARQFINSLM